MAKYSEKTEIEELKQELFLDFKRPLPSYFKLGRYAMLQMAATDRTFWTDIEEAESGNYIISNLSKKVSELDFEAITFAIAQTLYNQSYRMGNEIYNSGISRTISEDATKIMGDDVYVGEIITTRDDLIRLGWGVEPTTETKKKVDALIDTLHKTPVKVKYPNGDIEENYICAIRRKYSRKKDKAVLYNLWTNPIFGIYIKNQFGLLPQGVISDMDKACKKLKTNKNQHIYILLKFLSVQDNRNPKTIPIEKLIPMLRMEAKYKENRGRTEKQLLSSVCKVLVEMGMLNNYEVEYEEIGRKKRIKSITFHLNQNYIKKNTETEAALDGAENDKGK